MKKKYTIEVSTNDNDHLHIKRKNDGFNILELIGFHQKSIEDLMFQIRGEIKPDKVTREVVVDDPDLMTKQCKWCSTEFTTKNKAKIYCRNACTQRAYEKRKEIQPPNFL